MNCSPTIAIAVLLLSLTAGMWLLYKTQKENLGIFFKIVAWFIIVVSFGSMLCCGMRCIMHCGRHAQDCERSEQCEMGNSNCEMGGGDHCRMGHRGMGERVIILRGDEDGECEMGRGCCKDKMECNEGKEGCDEGKTECSKMGGDHACPMEGMGGEKKCDMKHMGMKKDSVVVKKK